MAYPHIFGSLPTGNVPASFLDDCFNAAAQLASPTFTGIPAAPTAAPGTNSTQLATTAYVDAKGGYQIIDSQNGISAVASYSKTGLGTTYTDWILDFNLLPVSNNVNLLLTFFDSGGVEIVTNYGYSQVNAADNGGTGGAGSGPGHPATSIVISDVAGNPPSNDAVMGGVSGTIRVFATNNNARWKLGIATVSYFSPAGFFIQTSTGFEIANGTTLSGIKLAFATGNIADGSARLLGLV